MATRGDGGVEESRPWLDTALLAGALLIGVGLLLGVFLSRNRTEPDSTTAELAHLKMLGTALKAHAEEHGGRFPASIDDIDWRQTLPGMQWPGLPAAVSRFHDPATGVLMKWSYYPGHTDADPPQTILAASPLPVGPENDQRLIARLDGTAEIVAEATFQFEIKSQASLR